jgi:hypothetical protein
LETQKNKYNFGKVKKIISCIIKHYNLMHVCELGSKILKFCSGSSCFQICTVKISKKCLKVDILRHFLQMGHSEAILPMRMLGPLGVKKEVWEGCIRGIRLPGTREEQIIGQYADDTNLKLRVEEFLVRQAVATLEKFSVASELTINWEKMMAYFWSRGNPPRPAWTRPLNWRWAEQQDISKLLGTPFGLSLSSAAVDQFLLERTDKQLQYWTNTRINRTGRAVIANAVLIGATLYFLSIWGGTQASVKKLEAKARNYLWAGTIQHMRACAAWDVVCLSRKEGGLNMINPKHMVIALMCKWILNACEPRQSNFKTMIRYRLERYQPHAHGSWNCSMQWFLRPEFKASARSRAWNRTMTSWKHLVQDVSLKPPSSYEEWHSSAFWWDAGREAIGPMFSKQRASELHNRGLQFVRDAWIEDRATICSAEEAGRRFALEPTEYTSWARIGFPLSQVGQRFLIRWSARPENDEWVGLFPTRDSLLPEIVYRGCEAPQGLINAQAQHLLLTNRQTFFKVMDRSRTLV